MKDRITEQKGETQEPIHWFTLQMAIVVGAGPGQVQEPRAPSISSTRMTETEALVPFSNAFSSIFISRAWDQKWSIQDTNLPSDMGGWHCK